MSSYDHFRKDLSWSEKQTPGAIRAFLAKYGGEILEYKPRANDGGIDAVWLFNGLKLFIDFKNLSDGRQGDIPLEYLQLFPSGERMGWAVDPSKTTTLYAFYWVKGNRYGVNLRVYPAAALRIAALRNREKWQRYLKKCSFAYHSTRVAFVPPSEFEAAINPDALNGLGG